MINIEKQIASESVDDDLLNISTLLDSDHEMEDEDEAELNRKQQAKKIVEVDNVIVEKEEILKKLLDTVRGYSAMKVRTVSTVYAYALFVIWICIFTFKFIVPFSFFLLTNFFLFVPRFSNHNFRVFLNSHCQNRISLLHSPYSIHISLHMYLLHLTYTACSYLTPIPLLLHSLISKDC